METLDRQILELLGRYRVSVRSIFGMMSENGRTPDVALALLQREGFILRNRSLAANHGVYSLTTKGSALLGLTEARARLFKAQALFKHLGILLFCHREGSRRYRLEDEELGSVVGDELPDGAHCMALSDERPVLLNLYVPGRRTKISSISRHVRDQLASARKLPRVAPLIADRTYGFAIVTGTTERRKAILAALRQPERGGQAPLATQVRIYVEAIPEFDQLINGRGAIVEDEPSLACKPERGEKVAAPLSRPTASRKRKKRLSKDRDDSSLFAEPSTGLE